MSSVECYALKHIWFRGITDRKYMLHPYLKQIFILCIFFFLDICSISMLNFWDICNENTLKMFVLFFPVSFGTIFTGT